MDAVVRYTHRLRPGRRAVHALLDEWDAARWVWNQCVEHDLPPATMDKKLTALRAEHDWLRAKSSVVQQQVVRDHGTTRARRISDLKKKALVVTGAPRFKSKRIAQPSLNYTLRGFQIRDGRLRLAGKIVIPVVWSRALPSNPTSVRVYRDASGHWWASFVVRRPIEPLPATGKAVGIDWGVTQTATTSSDDHDLDHAEHRKNEAETIARLQRAMTRRKPAKGQPASRGYKAVKRQHARHEAVVARRRADDFNKWAKHLVRDFDVLAVENFKPGFMQHSALARKAGDGAIAKAKQTLETMAAKHERTVVLVDPAYTTMDCSMCGARAKHRIELSIRTFVCAGCGYTAPRDKNSANVMLVRAGFNPVRAQTRGIPRL